MFIGKYTPTVIEVVDLVWKGLRQSSGSLTRIPWAALKSLTWFGRDCDYCDGVILAAADSTLKSLTWFGRDCDLRRATPPR